MIGASIHFPVNMADPDLAEMAKKVPAVIEQSRVGVIDYSHKSNTRYTFVLVVSDTYKAHQSFFFFFFLFFFL